jgi:cytochrome c biogenesis protein CcmG/thiol:disulfide interchange protein DsbE
MRVTTSWAVRWTAALGLAAVLMVWPLGCAPDDDHADIPAPPPGAELARLSDTLMDMEGRPVKLEDYRGRPLLVNFWATWCAPCRVEMPYFVELVEQYKDRKFMVLAISVDDEPAALKQFASELKVPINFPLLVGLGHDDLQMHYDATSLPVSWFVRADGSVDFKHRGAGSKAFFEEHVARLFEPRPAGGAQ